MAHPKLEVSAMKEEDIKERIDALLFGGSNTGKNQRSHELYHGALNLMALLYGPGSLQVENFTKEAETIRTKLSGETAADYLTFLAKGALQNLKAELEAGLIVNLHKTITG